MNEAMTCAEFTQLNGNSYCLANNIFILSSNCSSFSFECDDFYAVSQSNGVFESNTSLPAAITTNREEFRDYSLGEREEEQENLHYRGISFGEGNQMCAEQHEDRQNAVENAPPTLQSVEDPFEQNRLHNLPELNECKNVIAKEIVKSSPKRIRLELDEGDLVAGSEKATSGIKKLSSEVKSVKEQVGKMEMHEELKEAIRLLNESCVSVLCMC